MSHSDAVAGLAVVVSPAHLPALMKAPFDAHVRLLDGALGLVTEVAALARPWVVLELGVLEALGIGIVPAVLLARPATRVTLWRAGGPDAEPILPDQASDPASWTVGLVVTASGNAARAPRHRLTAREAEIVSAMAMGRTNAEIAHCLGVSTDTVKTHARRIFSRLDARDRAHAVAIALREGQIC